MILSIRFSCTRAHTHAERLKERSETKHTPGKVSSKIKDRDLKGFFNVMDALDLAIEEVELEKNTES